MGKLVTAKSQKMVARAIMLKRQRKSTNVLLVRKKDEPDTWELPGGRRKFRERWLDALIRELREELNLKVQVGQCQKWGQGKMQTSHDHTETIRVVLYTVTAKGRKKAKNEILEYIWVPLHNLSSVPLERKTKIMLWLYFRFGGGSL